MKCILLFLFLNFLNLIKFLLLMNLHVCSSFSTWMIFHGISYLLCLLMNQYSLTTWWKFLHSFLSLLFFEVFPNLMAFFFSHCLMLFQNLISPWWISFLPSLMEWIVLLSWWTLFPKLDDLFIFFFFWIGLIVFIEDHKVNTSSSWDLSMHT